MCGIDSGVTRDGHYRIVDDVMALRLAFGKVRTDIICSWSLRLELEPWRMEIEL